MIEENEEFISQNTEDAQRKLRKYADISGWSRDLLTDPEALFQCDFVMKEGISYPTSHKVINDL